MPSEPLIPVIGYIRVSMAREEMISPEIQRSAVTDWARRTGRRIIDWVPDLDKSGRNFRRKVMGVIERIERGEAAEIAVYRYDRWGRNAVESLANCRRVEMVGGQVQSATEPFDIETAIGKYSRTNAFAIAEMQSDLISENWKSALKNRVDRGLPPGGSAHFAYVRLGRVPDPYAVTDRQRYRRDPDDDGGERYEPDYASGLVDVHIEMYDRYLSGAGFRTIGEWLNSRGIRNTRGSRWSDVTVKNVMDSGFAAGLLRQHDDTCRCGKPSSCKRRMYVQGAQPPIIDTETWHAYRDLRVKKASMPPRSRSAAYPLSGVLWCGHCGASMKIQSGGHPTVAGYGYRCSRWHHYRDCDGPFPRRLVVEAAVRERLAEWAQDITTRAPALESSARTVRAAAEADRARLEDVVARTDAALRRLARQHALDDRMPAEVYEATRDEFLREREAAVTALERLDESVAASEANHLPAVLRLIDDWELIPAPELRNILAGMLRHVTVSRIGKGRRGGPVPVRVDVTPVWEHCDCARCA